MKNLFSLLLTGISLTGFAQYPTACGAVSARNNSNGQANTCAGVNGTAIAANFAGTAYNTVPAGAKTADITFKYLNVSYTTLKPYAITQVSNIVGGVSTILNSPAGPAGVPTLTGSNDALVKYCVYVTNIPTSGTLSFQLTNPETGANYATCFYDASCTANCNSTGGVLPLTVTAIRARKTSLGVQLEWNTSNEVNVSAFEIEKSRDGSVFSKIGTSPATGTATASYQFQDNSLSNAASWYRLRIINQDGSFFYSSVYRLSGSQSGFTVNHVDAAAGSDKISIDAFSELSGEGMIQLLDMQGKAVAKKQINISSGNNFISLNNLSGLSKGIYILKISSKTSLLFQQKLFR
jgi:hypothetical protein